MTSKFSFRAAVVIYSTDEVRFPTVFQLEAWALRNGMDIAIPNMGKDDVVIQIDISKDLKKLEGVSDEKESSGTEKEYDCATDCCCEENRRKQKCRGEQSVQAGEGFGDSEKPYELPHHPV